MKVLCPIDFSTASVDAVRYAGAMCSNFYSCHIEMLHCIYSGLRSNIFLNYADFIDEKVRTDLNLLSAELVKQHSNLQLSYKILRGDPIDLIPKYIIENGYSLVIIGAKGLNAHKSDWFGNVAETLFEKATTPVLAVPQGYVFGTLQNIVLAVDEEKISSQRTVDPILEMVENFGSKLRLLHVRREGDEQLEFDPQLESYLEGFDFDYYSKYTRGSVNKSISELCLQVNADLLCMIHRDRGWFQNLFHESELKKELQRISLPLLVLRD